MIPRLAITVIAVLILSSSHSPGQQGGVTREEYLAYITAAAEQTWNSLESDQAQWRSTIDVKNVFGYNPPWNDPYLASVSAHLFEITGDRKYLERAKRLLLDYGKYRDAYPAEFYQTRPEYEGELPALPNVFTFGKYVHAFRLLEKHRALSPAERAVIAKNIAGSADYVVRFQEWGAMNRALLRAEALMYAARTLPEDPRSTRWRSVGESIANDSWGQWEIEDATGYNGVWLYSLLCYASDIVEDESLYRTPVLHYLFEFFLSLITPAGILPDYGDSNWGSSWERMIPFFEKGAAVYRDGRLRWAAEQHVARYLRPAPEKKSIFIAQTLLDAYRWADFSLPATPPGTGSQQVLEDLVGKKVVFRDGWTPTSTYLLYNYRDEWDGAWLAKEYLRTTIPVEEEKMHHGHADENSIIMLMRNNALLLHDAGYRDYMPSGPFGAFRADYYHNRLVVRDGKIALGQKQGEYRFATPNESPVPGQGVIEFFRNSGAHRDVRTRMVDFLRLEGFEMVRTHLEDVPRGYEADRAVVYVKELDWFVVFDIVRFTRQGYLTMAPLWHTQRVVTRGEGWFDTAYDSLRGLKVGGDQNLLVVFPRRAQLQTGVEGQRRYYQDEQTIYQLIGRHGYLNDLQAFVTVLIPHDASAKPEQLASSVRMLENTPYPRAAGLTIDAGGKRYTIGIKLDMQAENVSDWKRPMYSYESGRTPYGDFETDGYGLFVVEDKTTLRYAMTGGVKVTYKGRVLHEQLSSLQGLRFDGSAPGPGVGKLRVWEETVRK